MVVGLLVKLYFGYPFCKVSSKLIKCHKEVTLLEWICQHCLMPKKVSRAGSTGHKSDWTGNVRKLGSQSTENVNVGLLEEELWGGGIC